MSIEVHIDWKGQTHLVGQLYAAERCRVAQPSLSKSVHKLEEESGTKLLLRSASGAVLTAAGRTFYNRVIRILDEMDQAQRELTGFKTA